MTKRSKVAWQPAAVANSSACPPVGVDDLGAVVKGGSPNAAAAKHSDAASAATAAIARRTRLSSSRALMWCLV